MKKKFFQRAREWNRRRGLVVQSNTSRGLEESLETIAWRGFSETYRTIYSYINSDLRRYGLTPPQYTVMRLLGNSKLNKMAMSEIGKEMIVTFANVTTIVDNLEKLDYVRRVRDPVDRRRITVELTSLGSRTFQKIRGSHVMEIEKLMSTLNKKELTNLTLYMKKLKKRAL
jgi:MarR family 2-MHQ and catechol resistance regulon transcriptional repressor